MHAQIQISGYSDSGQNDVWLILKRVSDVQEVSAEQVMKHFQPAMVEASKMP